MIARRAAEPWTLWAGCGALAVLALLDLAGAPVIATLPLPCLLLAIAVLLVGSWLLVDRLARDAPVDLKLLDTGMLSLAAMALLGLVLGTLGILSFAALMLGTGLLVAVTVPLVSRGRAGQAPANGKSPEDDRRTESRRLRERLPHWTTLLLAGLTAFAVVQGIGGRLWRPPIGDALAYHLPFAVEWLQQGDLGMPVPAAGDPSPPFYPLNSSLWMFWALAPFESDALVRFVQAPFLLLLGLAAYRLAREIGARTHAALAAAALSVTLPDIARAASLAENDLILAALLVTATANLARLWSEPAFWRVAMTALPLGLAAGTKVIALPYAGLLAIGLAGVVFWRWRSQRFVKPAGMVLVAAGLVVLLGGYSYLRNAVVMDNPLYPAGYVIFGREIFSGIYVMTREWRESHVFYPFDWSGFFLGSRGSFGYTVSFWVLPGLAAAGVALLATAVRSANGRVRNHANALGATSPARVGLECNCSRGEPRVRPSGVRASITGEHEVRPYDNCLNSPASWPKGRDATAGINDAALEFQSWPALALALWTVLSLGIFWFVVPYHFSRFLYPTIVWGIVAAAWGVGALLDWLPAGRDRVLTPVLALPFILLNVVNVPLDLSIRSSPLYWVTAAVVIGGTSVAIAIACSLSSVTRRRVLVALTVSTMVIASLAWPLYESRYEDRRFDEWRAQIRAISSVTDAWEWLDRQTEEQPATIAVAGTNDIYALYGEGLDNRIITIRPTGEIVRYDWGQRSHVFGAPDQAAWLDALDRAGVEYIFMTEDVSLGGWPEVRAWIAAQPDRFTLIFENEDATIWSVAEPE